MEKTWPFLLPRVCVPTRERRNPTQNAVRVCIPRELKMADTRVLPSRALQKNYNSNLSDSKHVTGERTVLLILIVNYTGKRHVQPVSRDPVQYIVNIARIQLTEFSPL